MFLTDNHLTFSKVREFYENNVASRLETGNYKGAARHLEVLEEGLRMLSIAYRGGIYFDIAQWLKKNALVTSRLLRERIYGGTNELEQLSEQLHAELIAGEIWTNKPKRNRELSAAHTN